MSVVVCSVWSRRSMSFAYWVKSSSANCNVASIGRRISWSRRGVSSLCSVSVA